jgi:hypothetical protein
MSKLITINIFIETKKLLDELKLETGKTNQKGLPKKETYQNEVHRLLTELLERRLK